MPTLKQTRKIKFNLFRYQILPVSVTQLSLFTTLDYNTLKGQKNDLFAKAFRAINTFFDIYNNPLVHRIFVSQDDIFVFKLGRQKVLPRQSRKFESEYTDDYPNITIAINNKEEQQIIAISEDKDAFSNTKVVAKILELNLNFYLKEFALEVVVAPILEENEFWDLVGKHGNELTQLRFELIKPNMANISGAFKKEIRQLSDLTNSLKTVVELNAPEGSALENIDKSNPLLNDLVQYSVAGGATQISMKVKGMKKRIQAGDTIKEVEIDEAEFRGEEKGISRFLAKLLKA